MAKTTIHNVKLGVFVLAGLLFLILLLYMIGKNSSLFQSNFVLKARFENTQGLMAGNNVRFAGIESGTVKSIVMLNDSVIEVTMLIDKKMLGIIRKNALVSVGTEGLVGNKLINIIPSKSPADPAAEGDILISKTSVDTDAMLRTLENTSKDIAVIASELKLTAQRINNSDGLWTLIEDKSVPNNLGASLKNIRNATGKAVLLGDELNAIIADVRGGKGAIGALLTDSSFATNLNEAIIGIQSVSREADTLAADISSLISGVRKDVDNGKGAVNALFKDSLLVAKLNATLNNLEMGTDGFNQNMEALKHNFLFRGYFRKLERKKKKADSPEIVSQ